MSQFRVDEEPDGRYLIYYRSPKLWRAQTLFWVIQLLTFGFMYIYLRDLVHWAITFCAIEVVRMPVIGVVFKGEAKWPLSYWLLVGTEYDLPSAEKQVQRMKESKVFSKRKTYYY